MSTKRESEEQLKRIMEELSEFTRIEKTLRHAEAEKELSGKNPNEKEEGLPEFLEGFRPDMTLLEFNEAMKKRIERMDCNELYRAIDEARIFRESIFDPVLHIMLTGFIHHGSRKLSKECPEHYRRLTEKYKIRELEWPVK